MTRTRLYPLFFFAASGAILLGALGFQFIGGLAPCPLCLYQRWPHVAVLAICGLAALLGGARSVPLLLVLGGLAFWTAAGIAGFHVGVEQKWWKGLEACAGLPVDLSKMSLEDMRKAAAAPPPPRCDEIPWSLFGISMAGYNFLLSLGLGALAMIAAVRLFRRAGH